MREKLSVIKSTGSSMVPMTRQKGLPMIMARGLPMTRRRSPEAASCHVEEFQFVTKGSFIVSLVTCIVLYMDSV